jgi:hypothetical protein
VAPAGSATGRRRAALLVAEQMAATAITIIEA